MKVRVLEISELQFHIKAYIRDFAKDKSKKDELAIFVQKCLRMDR